jgi:flagellar biosynthesis protein FlhF
MLPPKRFQAETLADAYAKVREELGGNAVILSTRKVNAPAIFGQPARTFVEVVAHLPAGEVAAPEPRPNFDQDIAAHELVRGVAEASAAGLAIDPAAELAPPFANAMAGTSAPEAAEAKPRPAAVNAEPGEQPSTASEAQLVGDIAKQLADLREAVERIAIEREQERVDAGPAVLRDCRDLLIRQGLPVALVTSIVDQVGASLVRGGDLQAALSALERKLAARMPEAAKLPLARKPAVVFLVGPAGAGKTTAAIRLGLELERQHLLRVAVAGTDVNRAGGPQQLVAFGAASGLRTELCYAPAELQRLMASGEVDLVIVDTPGHNGSRRDRMTELEAFMRVCEPRSVMLVLPATMKGSDLTAVAAAYRSTGIDGLMLTRCDETSTYGALAGVAIEAGAGVAYTTHSDQVSDPPRGGDHFALASAVVRGRWAEPAAARSEATVGLARAS